MDIQDLIVAALVFGAVYFLGNKLFKRKKDKDCKCDNNDSCDHKQEK